MPDGAELVATLLRVRFGEGRFGNKLLVYPKITQIVKLVGGKFLATHLRRLMPRFG